MDTNMVASRVKQRRKELHISQEELAQRLGYDSYMPISRIELGQIVNINNVDLILNLAKALDTSYDYLVADTDDPTRTAFDNYWYKLRSYSSSRAINLNQFEDLNKIELLNPEQKDLIMRLIEFYLNHDEDSDRVKVLSTYISTYLETIDNLEKSEKK